MADERKSDECKLKWWQVLSGFIFSVLLGGFLLIVVIKIFLACEGHVVNDNFMRFFSVNIIHNGPCTASCSDVLTQISSFYGTIITVLILLVTLVQFLSVWYYRITSAREVEAQVKDYVESEKFKDILEKKIERALKNNQDFKIITETMSAVSEKADSTKEKVDLVETDVLKVREDWDSWKSDYRQNNSSTIGDGLDGELIEKVRSNEQE